MLAMQTMKTTMMTKMQTMMQTTKTTMLMMLMMMLMHYGHHPTSAERSEIRNTKRGGDRSCTYLFIFIIVVTMTLPVSAVAQKIDIIHILALTGVQRLLALGE